MLYNCNTPTFSRYNCIRGMMAISEDLYYDVVVIGKVKMGKSSLGDRLLQLRRFSDDDIIKDYTNTDQVKSGRFSFLQVNKASLPNAAQRCKLLANEVTKIRVLDTPGFDDSSINLGEACTASSMYQKNNEIFRSIFSLVRDRQLQVRRVVYFIPIRDPPEKMDGSMIEELEIMYKCLGPDVFKCMVIAATQSAKSSFDKEDIIESVQKVYTAAFNQVVKNIICPPVIYVRPHDDDDDDDIVTQMKQAKVIDDNIFHPEIRAISAQDAVPATTIGDEHNDGSRNRPVPNVSTSCSICETCTLV